MLAHIAKCMTAVTTVRSSPRFSLAQLGLNQGRPGRTYHRPACSRAPGRGLLQRLQSPERSTPIASSTPKPVSHASASAILCILHSHLISCLAFSELGCVDPSRGARLTTTATMIRSTVGDTWPTINRILVEPGLRPSRSMARQNRSTAGGSTLVCTQRFAGVLCPADLI